MESKHTPGPWHQPVRYSPEDNKPMPCGAVEDETGAAIAVACLSDARDLDTWRANARLIAAAPELLAALVFCVEALEVEAPIYRDHIAQAKAAIAKAKGE
jgi:hypothetical protein